MSSSPHRVKENNSRRGGAGLHCLPFLTTVWLDSPQSLIACCKQPIASHRLSDTSRTAQLEERCIEESFTMGKKKAQNGRAKQKQKAKGGNTPRTPRPNYAQQQMLADSDWG